MFAVLILAVAVLAAPENLLQNTDFANALDGWRVEAGTATVSLQHGDDGPAVSILGATVDGYPRLAQDFVVQPGAVYGAEALALDTGITGGYGAYLTLEFHDAANKRLHFEQSSPALPGCGWTRLIARCAAPAAAVRGSVFFVLRGAGEGRYRAPKLFLLEPAPPAPSDGVVTLRVGDALKTPFLGFGVEDDGWLANADNAAQGVTLEDVALVQSRTEWMNPAAVRMFCWYEDWNPAGDWQRFDFETDNMRSRYRALDLYQRIGATVNLTGVEWNRTNLWSQPEAMARAIGELFVDLVQRRGYTCIKQWTLTNEPNTHFVQEGASFAGYARIHALVAAEFRARGLSIEVVGSDDTNGGLPWFEQCVATPAYFDTAGIFASHFYLQSNSLRAAKFHIADRIQLLAGRKPFVIAEFGFQDPRSGTLVNPLMDEFQYALLTAALACEATALGTSGMTIWCLHEVYYPMQWLMNYGLWRYKDRGWAPRPVFYAWAMLTRGTRPGAAVRPLIGGMPSGVQAVVIGDVLYFVNSGDIAVRLKMDGFAIKTMHVIDEAHLPAGDVGEAEIRTAAEGRAVATESGVLILPPRSFGRAE